MKEILISDDLGLGCLRFTFQVSVEIFPRSRDTRRRRRRRRESIPATRYRRLYLTLCLLSCAILYPEHNERGLTLAGFLDKKWCNRDCVASGLGPCRSILY